MILFIFIFVLILRAIFWGLVAVKTHLLESETTNRQTRGFISTQKYSALSFILETIFWFMLIVPNTPLSVSGGIYFVHYFMLGLFALQIVPAVFAWMWWDGRIEAKTSILQKMQAFFGITVLALLILGAFSIFYTILINLPLN